MGITIFYKGTLNETASPQDVFDIAVCIADQMGWTCRVEGDALAIDIPDSFSETLVLNFVNRRIDGWCKYDLEEPEEFETALELFYAIRPLFAEYEVFDDFGQWFECLAEKEPLDIRLRELTPNGEEKVRRACAVDLKYSLVMDRSMDSGLLAKYLKGELFLRLVLDDMQRDTPKAQKYRSFYEGFTLKTNATSPTIASHHKCLAMLESWLLEKMGLIGIGQPSANPAECWEGLPEATRESILSFYYAMGNTLFMLYCPTISVEDARIRKFYTEKVEPEAADGTDNQSIYQQALLAYRYVLSSLEYLGLSLDSSEIVHTGESSAALDTPTTVSDKPTVPSTSSAVSARQPSPTKSTQNKPTGMTKKLARKMIDGIIAPVIAEEGFHAITPDEPGTLLYARQVGDVIHYIYFRALSSSTPQGSECRLEQVFYTDVENGSSGRPYQLQEGLTYEEELRWYQTEEQFKKHLTDVARFIVQTIIPLFDCLARPKRSTTRELYEELSVDTQKKAMAFAKQHGLSWRLGPSCIRKMVIATEEIIKEVQFKPFEEVKDLLLGATAYLGELVRKTYGGKWVWGYNKVYLLGNIGGHEDLCSGFLENTLEYWQVPELYHYTLRYDYGQLLNSLSK